MKEKKTTDQYMLAITSYFFPCTSYKVVWYLKAKKIAASIKAALKRTCMIINIGKTRRSLSDFSYQANPLSSCLYSTSSTSSEYLAYTWICRVKKWMTLDLPGSFPDIKWTLQVLLVNWQRFPSTMGKDLNQLRLLVNQETKRKPHKRNYQLIYRSYIVVSSYSLQ